MRCGTASSSGDCHGQLAGALLIGTQPELGQIRQRMVAPKQAVQPGQKWAMRAQPAGLPYHIVNFGRSGLNPLKWCTSAKL